LPCAIRCRKGSIRLKSSCFDSKRNGRLFLIDQESTNGTFLNGNSIRQERLKPGDVLQLGKQGPEILVQIVFEEGDRPGALGTFGKRTFYNPEKERRSNYAGTIAALGIAGFLILIVLLILLGSLGVEGVFVGSVLAFLPAPFYLFIFVDGLL
jgi:hypothetical protein